MKKLKFKLTIAYDGTNYAGWQVQQTGIGVQQRVEEAFIKIFPSVRQIHSSSRTDTGVHALGMVAHVEIPQAELKMPPAKLPLAINAHLPQDIRVIDAVRCRSSFHARFDATGKQYRYFVWNHRTMNPLLRHQAWAVHQPLDLAAMRAAARHLVGKHDFTSFAGTRNYRLLKMESAVRTVTHCEIIKRGPLLTFVIEGDGFLYKMCRCIVGTLVQVGQGKFNPADVNEMLAKKDRGTAGMTAPAQGLVLWKVMYGRKTRRKRTPGAARAGMNPV